MTALLNYQTIFKTYFLARPIEVFEDAASGIISNHDTRWQMNKKYWVLKGSFKASGWAKSPESQVAQQNILFLQECTFLGHWLRIFIDWRVLNKKNTYHLKPERITIKIKLGFNLYPHLLYISQELRNSSDFKFQLRDLHPTLTFSTSFLMDNFKFSTEMQVLATSFQQYYLSGLSQTTNSQVEMKRKLLLATGMHK